MKRLIIAGGLASLVAWAGAPAQAEQQTQDAKGKTVTLTGCLAKGDTADSFMLNKATMSGTKGATGGASGGASGSGAAGGASGSAAGGASGSGAAGGASGSTAAGGASGSGAAGGASGSGQGMTYHLSPGKVQKMEAHVGHTVEITGTMDAAGDKSKSSGASGSAGSTGAASKGKPAMQHVTVTGMKHVSATCS